MTQVSRTQRIAIWMVSALLLAAVAMPLVAFHVVRWMYEPDLPSVDELSDLQLQVPLRIYTRDGQLIGVFGAERRAPLDYREMPQRIVEAFLAAEDDRFFEHPGVDWRGLLRAAIKLVLTGEKVQGGSTITMQLARNVFLSPERSYDRKIREILLALRIEQQMSKEQILEIYLNKIFLGQRAYGVGAASQVYFGLEPAELSWAQVALLAGLPKAPSRDNPVASPQRAQARRDYVLRRLRDLGRISELEFEAARAEPVEVRVATTPVQVDARHLAEMIRADMVARYGESAYTDGYQVYATVSSQRQQAANRALRNALLAYEERHAWRGPEARLPSELLSQTGPRRDLISDLLLQQPAAAGLYAAAVVSFDDAGLTLLLADQQLVKIAPEGFKWAGIGTRKPLREGDIVRARQVGDGWRLAQLPAVQGAFVAIDPLSGAVEALVGGYDFLLSKYNRVVQAQRQPGSGFKPFLYAAAFERGLTPATVLLDAPVVFQDSLLEGAWRPENDDGDFNGPMRLREALVHSRNLVSIRLLQELGMDYVRDYVARFGLDRKRMPRDLSMALGTGTFSPMEMASAYAVIANGGYRVEPYVIERILDAAGATLFEADPARVCRDCDWPLMAAAEGAVSSDTRPRAEARARPQRIIDARIAWLVDDVLREVTVRGTAARARKLGRGDIAGKTGTTNDETDAWFNGYNGELAAVAWVGFDQPAPLGRGEVGSRAALPMWMEFMGATLDGRAETPRPRPPGLVNVRIAKDTGLLASGSDPDAMVEVVQEEHVPQPGERQGSGGAVSVEELF